MKKSVLLLALLIGTIGHAQLSVTGKVNDTSGEPLAGANVIEKGTTNGVITDFNGNYEITVASEGAILVVTYRYRSGIFRSHW